jgi:hypothetical protein
MKNNFVRKMEAKNRLKQEAKLMSDRYPNVSTIVVQLTYYHKAGKSVLMKRTVNFFPTSHAYFKMDCIIKDCDGTGFDFTRIISKLVKNKKKSAKGEMACHSETGGRSSEHSSISYEITIKYGKRAK